MKILIDARLYGLEHAGPGRYVMNLVDELAKLDLKNEYAVVLRRKYHASLKLPKNWKKILFDTRQYTVREQIFLPLILYRERPDLVHSPHLNVPILYFGKFVTTLHDIIMHRHKGGEATTRPFPIYQIWRFEYHLAFLKAVRSSKMIITPSKAVKKELTDFYDINPKKIQHTYEGIDKKVFPQKDSKQILKKYKLNEKYFLFVGSAYPHKNLDRVIKAIVQLNRVKKEKVEFAIVSSRGIFTERLTKKIKKYDAERYVKLLGFVPDTELGVLYRNSRGFIYPSLSEGFGLPGLEAIQAGTISLVSDIPVFREVYGVDVVYVDPESIESIKNGISKILDMSKNRRDKTIRSAQKFIQKYSWQKMANETLKIYESIGE